MPWYHRIATFLNYPLPQLRVTRHTNLALLTVGILERRALATSVLLRAWWLQLPHSHTRRDRRLLRLPAQRLQLTVGGDRWIAST